ncbi:MAG: pyridoxal-dependent decarboxylase [Acidobacteria bacterium]|nr:MAG: pyridoxal-dependent decarboxylase [Acidobacteriota bacterium]
MKSLEISPDEFRRLAEKVADLAAEYLREMDSRPIPPSITGEEVERLFRTPLSEQGIGEESLSGLRDVIEHSRAQNGRFFGYVLGSGEPVASVADLLASVLNQNVTAWRSGPAAVTVERTVVGWLAQAIGCAGFRGSLTGGGSSANLMGLAMAREAKMPANEAGSRGAPQAVIYASEEVHMSIPKSVALLGIGRKNLRLISTDSNFRLIPDELERAIQHDKAEGRIPIAVVASAGTVNTGSIDPLAQIAEIARGHGLWMHVDGAYGALAAIAAPGKFVGMDLADSLSLDPHKWLYQPLDCGCLLYRDVNAAHAAFAHTGDYAKALTNDPIEGFAFFEESLELSRRFRALKLWLSLRYHGLQAFRDAIQKDLDLAQRLASSIAKRPDMQLLAPVELSAVCFRYIGDKSLSEDELNRHNAAILKQVVKQGRVYRSNATLLGTFSLRACIVNHRTTADDVDMVVSEVLAAASRCGADTSTRSF